MSELLPCPFCGGEARIFHFSSAIRDEVWRAVCDKPFCAQGPDGYTEAEAIEAWNSRAERTCTVDGSILNEYGYTPQTPDYTFDLSCGHSITMYDLPDYCPNCGAKVVGE